MATVWIPVYAHEAEKGSIVLGEYRVIAIAKQDHFRARAGQCKKFPNRLLPPGTYRSGINRVRVTLRINRVRVTLKLTGSELL